MKDYPIQFGKTKTGQLFFRGVEATWGSPERNVQERLAGALKALEDKLPNNTAFYATLLTGPRQVLVEKILAGPELSQKSLEEVHILVRHLRDNAANSGIDFISGE